MAEGSHKHTDALTVERDGTVWDHVNEEEETGQKKEEIPEVSSEFNTDIYAEYIE